MVEEILSQGEIDALLSALSSGEMDAEELKSEGEEKRVRVYDFKRALRFSKDQIRSISRVHENFARLLTTFFSAQLRTYVDISVASVDQIPYEEFIRSIPRMTILNLYSVEPLQGKVVMEVNPNIAFGLLDRLLGGKSNNVSKVDNLTEIETVLLSQLFEKLTDSFREAWHSIVEIDPYLEELEVNPQFLQLVSPNETVVVVSLNTEVGNASGMINICIPHIVLEPIIPKLSVHYWMQAADKKRDPDAYEKISKNIERMLVEAKAILGHTHISVNDLLHLKENDFIKLDKKIDESIVLAINEEPKFFVQAGRVKNKLSVQVLDEIRERE